MIKESVSVEDVVDLMNEMLRAGPQAILKLCNSRVLCNEEVASHPTVQVGRLNSDGKRDPDGEIFTVGVIGLLNGVFGVNDAGWGPIAAVYDANGNITEFRKTVPTDWEG